MNKFKSLISMFLLLISVSYLSSCNSFKNKEYKYEIIETENFVLKKYGINNVIILDYNEKAEYEIMNLATNKELRKYKVVEIAPKSFSYSYGIKEVVIPGSVKKIGYQAFSWCSKLKKVHLKEGIRELEDNVFYRCLEISELSIPNSIEILGDNFGCYHYTQLDGSSLWDFKNQTIENGCYYYGNKINPYLILCSIDSSVTNLKIKKDTKFIFPDVFKMNLTNLVLHNDVKQLYYPKYDKLKTKIQNVTIYENGIYLGSDRNPYLVLIDTIDKEVVNINIHKDTKILGYSSLSECKNIVNLTLPDNLERIEWAALSYMDSLEEIDIPESVIHIDHAAFAANKNLKRVKLPSKISSIEYSAFTQCESLQEVNIPLNVTTIGNSAFDSTAIKEINLSDNIHHLGSGAFSGCSNLYSIVLPKHIYELQYTITGCVNLKELIMPQYIKILSGTFKKCQSLEYVVIPETVKIIENYAFSDTNIKILLKHKAIPNDFPEGWNSHSYDSHKNNHYYLKDQWSIDENGKVTIK